MKKTNQTPESSLLGMSLPKNHNRRQSMYSKLIIFFVALSMTGCFKPMFKTNTSVEVQSATLEQLIGAKKFFILHAYGESFSLDSLEIKKDTLKGHTGPLWGTHRQYLEPKIDRSNFYHSSQEKVLFTEVHIYAEDLPDSTNHINLAIDQISRMDVYEKDKAATTSARVGSVVAITVGVTLAVILAKEAAESTIELMSR